MKQKGIDSTLQQIYDQLPLYAEEGGVSNIVNADSLVNELSGSDEVNARLMVELVQRVFTLLGVLDTTILQHGIWRFVSFPASLLARSTLKSLADSDQSMFDSGFWNQQDSNSPVSDQQRNILHQVESHRQQHHKNNAQPVRYVHVAWGLIVVDGKVLLRHREDKNRTDLNNYVLVGGRVSQNDLMKANADLKSDEAIRVLQSPLASDSTAAIEIALKREITEETELEAGSHYTYSPWRTIKPYTAVEGGGANHALTEYRIHVYHIELSQEGIFALSKSCQNDSELSWFTLNELAQAKSADGKMAYIDALIEDYPAKSEWQAAVEDIKPSYTPSYPSALEASSITVPKSHNQPLLMGKTGKELRVECELDQTEHALLTSMCLHSKEPSCTSMNDSIELLPTGWIEILDAELATKVNNLALKLQNSNCAIIEGYNEKYYRIALPSNYIYLDNQFFSYQMVKTLDRKTEVLITREFIETDFVSLESSVISKELSNSLKIALSEMANGREIEEDNRATLEKNLRRIAPVCQKIGLRRLVRSIGGNPKLVVAATIKGTN